MMQKVDAIRRYFGSSRNATRKAKAALRTPRKALTYLCRMASERWIEAVFGSEDEYHDLVREIDNSKLMHYFIAKLRATFARIDGVTARGNAYTAGAMLTCHASCLYAFIR